MLNTFIPTTSTIVQTKFSELVQGGEILKSVGGEALWDLFVKGTLLTMQSVNTPRKITIVTKTALTGSASNISCSNITQIRELTRVLSNLDTSNSLSLTCEGIDWKVAKCSDINDKKTVCANCTSPCRSQASSGAASVIKFPADPCDQGSNVCLQALIVDFTLPYPPAAITNMEVSNIQRTRASLTVTTDSPGTVFCSAFGESTVPDSPISIVVENNFNSTSAILYTNNTRKATLDIPDLNPSTNYTLYCTTQSLGGSYLKLSESERFKILIYTSCCKSATVVQTTMTSFSGKNYADFFSFQLSSVPRYRTLFRFTVQEVVTTAGAVSLVNDTSLTLSPSEIVMTPNTDISSLIYISLLSSTARTATKEYTLRMVEMKADPSTFWYTFQPLEYSLEVPRGNITTLLGSSSTPSAPAIESALFTSDGTKVTVQFNSATNKGSLSNYFACSDLITFTGSATAKCIWEDAFRLVIQPGATTPRLISGSIIRFFSSTNSIKAACDSTMTATFCSAFSSMSVPTTVAVTASEDAVTPSVLVTMPRTLGSCDNVRIDLSPSSGNCGQVWTSASVEVVSSRNDSAALQVFLTSQIEGVRNGSMALIEVPYSYVPIGSYQFLYKLCNFLGKCGSYKTTMSVMGTMVPSVTIRGSNSRTILRSDNVSLSALSYMPVCGSTELSRQNLSLVWSVSLNNVILTRIMSQSKNTFKFSLHGFTLNAGNTYKVQVSAASSSQDTASITAVDLIVLSAPLVAVIAGGSERSIRFGEVVTVDASNSYDEDVSPFDRVNDNDLVYEWDCDVLHPVPSAGCPINFENATEIHDRSTRFYPDDDAFTLAPQPIFVGYPSTNFVGGMIVRISVIVTKDSRVSKQSVTLEVVSDKASNVKILTDLSGKVNPNRKLVVKGTVTANYQNTVSWTMADNSGLALSSVASSTTSALISAPSNVNINKRTKFNLVLPPSTLASDAQYVFKLSSSLTGLNVSSFSFLIVTTNGAPQPGQFLVSPTSGQELVDTFVFSMLNWVDDDLPLLYQFGFYSTSGELVRMGGRTDVSFYKNVLPSGDSNSSLLTTFATVYDYYYASSTEEFNLTVAAVSVITTTEMSNTLDSMLVTAGGEPDETKSALAVTSAAFNRIDCSQATATFCAARNREMCGTEPNRCGLCLAGYISGQSTGNDKCISTSSRRRLDENYLRFPVAQANKNVTTFASATSCATDSDCSGFELCTSSVCTVPTKDCLNACSSGGSCIFSNVNSGLRVTVCLVYDLSCEASCECNDGKYGPSCAYTLTEMQNRANFRYRMIESLEGVLDTDEPSTSIGGWVNLLSSITNDPVDIASTPEGYAKAVKIAYTILDSAVNLPDDVKLTSADSTNILKSINNLLTAMSPSSRNSSHYNPNRFIGFGRRLQSNTVFINDTTAQNNVNQVMSLTKLYGRLLSKDMVSGEAAQSLSLGSIRVATQAISLTEEKTLSLAATDTEATYASSSSSSASASSTVGAAAPVTTMTTLRMPVMNATATTTEAMEVSLVQLPASLYGNDTVNSNVIRANFLKIPGEAVNSTLKMRFVIQNTYQVDVARYSKVYPIECYNRRVIDHSYPCLGGYPNVETTCNGSAYQVELKCPSFYHRSSCKTLSLDSGSFDSGSCLAVAYTATNTTCECPMAVLRTSSTPTGMTTRRLTSTSAGQFGRYNAEADTKIYSEGGNVGDWGDGLERVGVMASSTDAADKDQFVDIATVSELVVEFFDKIPVLTLWPVEDPQTRLAVGTLAVFSIITLFFLILGQLADFYMFDFGRDGKDEKKIKKQKEDASVSWNEAETLSHSLKHGGEKSDAVVKLSRDSFNAKGSGSNALLLQLKMKQALDQAKRSERLRLEAEMPSLRQIMFDSIPQIYSGSAFYARLWSEFLMHHKAMGIFFHYSPYISRTTRVIFLATQLNIFFFVALGVVRWVYYDDGICMTYLNEESCHETLSMFDVYVPYCKYNPFENTCYLRIPYEDQIAIIFVSMLSYMLCIPLFMAMEKIVNFFVKKDEDNDYKHYMGEIMDSVEMNEVVTLTNARPSSVTDNDPKSWFGMLTGSSSTKADGKGKNGSKKNKKSKKRSINGFFSKFSQWISYKIAPAPNPTNVSEVVDSESGTPMRSKSSKTNRSEDDSNSDSDSGKEEGRKAEGTPVRSSGKAISQMQLSGTNKHRSSSHNHDMTELERRKSKKSSKSKKSKKSKSKKEEEESDEEDVSGIVSFFENIGHDRAFENQVLGSTLTQDLDRWSDALSLYGVMVRLGAEAEVVTNTMIYGEHYSDLVKEFERLYEEHLTGYRLWDKKGEFNNPFKHNWGIFAYFTALKNYLFCCFSSENRNRRSGAVLPMSDEKSFKAPKKLAAPSLTKTDYLGRTVGATNANAHANGAAGGTVDGPVSISGALRQGQEDKERLNFEEKRKKMLASYTRKYFVRMRHSASDEVKQFRNMTNIDRARRIMFLAHMDLVDSRTAKIASSKMAREQVAQKDLTWSSSLFLASLNVVLIIAIAITAYDLSNPIQYMWFYCTLAFLVLDHIMINPLRIFMLHVALPMMGGAADGLAKARSFIVKHLRNFTVDKKNFNQEKGGGTKRRNTVSTKSDLNVVPYAFVSYRLAKVFPALRESQAVRSMVTSYSQLHLVSPDKKATIWKPYLYLVYAFIDMPLGLQDVLVHYVSAMCSCFVALLVAVLNVYQPSIVPVGIASVLLVYVAIVMSNYYTQHKDEMKKDDAGYAKSLSLKAGSVAPAPATAADKYAQLLKFKELHSRAPVGSHTAVELMRKSNEAQQDVNKHVAAQEQTQNLDEEGEAQVYDLISSIAEKESFGHGVKEDADEEADQPNSADLSNIKKYLHEKDEEEDVRRPLNVYTMKQSDLNRYNFGSPRATRNNDGRNGRTSTHLTHAGGNGMDITQGTQHHLFLRDNIRKLDMAKSETLYESANRALDNRGGKPTQKAMRLMFQSAMAALDAGQESLAKKRLMGASPRAPGASAANENKNGASEAISRHMGQTGQTEDNKSFKGVREAEGTPAQSHNTGRFASFFGRKSDQGSLSAMSSPRGLLTPLSSIIRQSKAGNNGNEEDANAIKEISHLLTPAGSVKRTRKVVKKGPGRFAAGAGGGNSDLDSDSGTDDGSSKQPHRFTTPRKGSDKVRVVDQRRLFEDAMRRIDESEHEAAPSTGPGTIGIPHHFSRPSPAGAAARGVLGAGGVGVGGEETGARGPVRLAPLAAGLENSPTSFAAYLAAKKASVAGGGTNVNEVARVRRKVRRRVNSRGYDTDNSVNSEATEGSEA